MTKNVNIYSVSAANIYCVAEGITFENSEGKHFQAYYDFERAVMPDSLFLRYMEDKLTYDKFGYCRDFIKVSFEKSANAKHTGGINEGKHGKHHNTLRKKYYEEGITIRLPHAKRVVHYKMLYRTAGDAKEGKVVFIRSQLYKKALNYLTMGLYEHLPDKDVNIVGLAAYQSLVTGAAIDYINIPLEQILIIKDKEVESLKKGLPVKVDNGHCVVDRADTKTIKNILWDGMGLIDESIFLESMTEFVYCRNHFFKACLFRCNIQEYFKDYFKEKYDTAKVTDMFGNRICVKDIKVITTENAIKWLKFDKYMGNNPYRTYKNWLKKYDNKFAIIKTGHESKYGDLQRTSYQINNSLPTTDKEILLKIATPSIDYINSLKTSNDAFVQHLKATRSPYKINDVFIALNDINDKFQYSTLYKKRRDAIVNKFLYERVMRGKLFLPGDNLTICGNPIALLLQAVGKEYSQENCFDIQDNAIQCYTTRFGFGKKLAAFRNPHNSMNNIVCFQNIYCPEIEKYFPKLGKNVIVVNGIGTDVQARLNGMDMDSDFVFVTDYEEMVQLAEVAYIKYPTIINCINYDTRTLYNKDSVSYANMDNKIQKAQVEIGQASNLAQIALSHYVNCNMDNQELENIFVIASVLAQCAIDSAKRTFEITVSNAIRELEKSKCIKAEDEYTIYPRFFYDIYKDKNDKDDEEMKKNKIRCEELMCPMEILPIIIKNNVIDKNECPWLKTSSTHISTWFRYPKNLTNKELESEQYKKIADKIEMHYKKIKSFDNEQKDEKNEEFYSLVKSIKAITNFEERTMHTLIAYALSIGSFAGCHLLTVLFAVDNEKFLNCFLSTKNEQKAA